MTPSARDSTRRWLLRARKDLRVAERFVAGQEPDYDLACYLAQQAAEKVLKAALIFSSLPFPKVHDLDKLRDALSVDWTVKSTYPALQSLTAWEASSRYPEGVEATEQDARDAVALATGIWRSVTDDLRPRGFDVHAELPER